MMAARLRRYDAMAGAIASAGAQGREGTLDAGDRQRAAPHGASERLAHRVVAMTLEQLVQLLDAAARELRLAVGDLGEQRKRFG